jgi:hypothetical protein
LHSRHNYSAHHLAPMVHILLALLFLILLPFSTTHASAVPHCSLIARQSVPLRWSKQDILNLVGVCVAVITVIVGVSAVLVASPKLRRWVYKPFYRFIPYLRSGKCSHPRYFKLWELIDGLGNDLGEEERPSSRRALRVENWKKMDLRAVRRQLQDQYDELLEMRKGRF